MLMRLLHSTKLFKVIVEINSLWKYVFIKEIFASKLSELIPDWVALSRLLPVLLLLLCLLLHLSLCLSLYLLLYRSLCHRVPSFFLCCQECQSKKKGISKEESDLWSLGSFNDCWFLTLLSSVPFPSIAKGFLIFRETVRKNTFSFQDFFLIFLSSFLT